MSIRQLSVFHGPSGLPVQGDSFTLRKGMFLPHSVFPRVFFMSLLQTTSHLDVVLKLSTFVCTVLQGCNDVAYLAYRILNLNI